MFSKIFIGFLLTVFFGYTHISVVFAEIVFREEFENISNWEKYKFPNIDTETEYLTTKKEGLSVLQAKSDSSASGLFSKREFDIYKSPILRWSWKVSSVFKNGDATKKTGDDYPLRIYVLFKYDPDEVSWLERRKYDALKLALGEYPPRASLNYILSLIHI